MKVLVVISLFLSSVVFSQDLPEVEILNTKGKKVNKDSILSDDKVVVLNFWASWCDPCKKEMREITRIKSGSEFKNVKFVSVTIDQPDAVSAAKDWFKNNKCSWSLYIDSKQELFNKVLAVTENTSSAIPVCIVIDKNGKIVSFNSGFEADTYKDELINNIKLAEGN